MTTAVKEEVTFVCEKRPMLHMGVVSPSHRFDNKGNAYPIAGKDAYFAKGILKTSDDDTINYVRNSEDYKNGIILELRPEEEAVPVNGNVPVIAGARTTGKRAPEIAAPAPKVTATNGKAVKVPKRKS